MFTLPLAFAAPAVLVALAGLGALYYLLRVTPPTPRRTLFPPMRLLLGLVARENEPARTPWPVLALRLAVAALIIVAMAQPLWRSLSTALGSGPLLVLIDDGWPAAPTFEKRIDYARRETAAAARAGRTVAVKALTGGGREIVPLSADETDGRLRSLAPAPYSPPRQTALPAIEQFLTANPGADVLWIADGVELGGARDFASRLSQLARSVDVVTDGTGARAPRGRRKRCRVAEGAARPVRRVRARDAGSRARSTPRAARSGARLSTSQTTSPSTSVSTCRSSCETRRRGS